MTASTFLVGSLGSGVVLGGLFGARHAFEADHVAAVATLVEDARRPLRTGAAWGIGHSVPIVAIGLAFLVADVQIPDAILSGFELLVGAILLWLGGRVLAGRDSLALVVHEHLDAGAETDADGHRHLALFGTLLGLTHSHADSESMAVGVIHGLAGSGGVVVALAATRATTLGSLGFLLGFAVASVVAMAVGAATWARAVDRANWLHPIAGLASMVAGAMLLADVLGVAVPI